MTLSQQVGERARKERESDGWPENNGENPIDSILTFFGREIERSAGGTEENDGVVEGNKLCVRFCVRICKLHTHMRKCEHTSMHTCTRALSFVDTHTRARKAHAYTSVLTHARTCICTHTYTHIHTHIHTLTHTYTHRHT